MPLTLDQARARWQGADRPRGPRGARPAAVLALLLAATVGAAEPESTAPRIVRVVGPDRLAVGATGEVRITYVAPAADVAAVVVTVEDLDGPLLGRASTQREVGVVAAAFGRDAGELAVPLAFRAPGPKRVTLVLLTAERTPSEPVVMEVEAGP